MSFVSDIFAGYTKSVKLALAQINPTIGDFLGNVRKIVDVSLASQRQGADLVIFPEMAVCGYPPADLLEKSSFLARAQQAIEEIAERVTSNHPIAVLCGCPTPAPSNSGKRVMNSAMLLRDGRVEFIQSKMLLPYYDVFDEQRYFAPAAKQVLYEMAGERVAITICEDAWNDKNFWPQRLYPVDPVENLMHQGATFIVNLSASPYYRDKREMRRAMLAAIARRHRIPVAMVNQVGGNDSLIFDGSSLVLDEQGETIAQAKSFQEDLVIVDLSAQPRAILPSKQDEDAAVYEALVLGTRDYVRKCGFSKGIVGLSGGIDSALVATIAAEALGAENVLGVGMPSEYSSQGSIDDARHLAAESRHPVGTDSNQRHFPAAFESPAADSQELSARHYRREPAVQNSWRAADGVIEQTGGAGADDRQQIGDGDRILYPVRRHGWSLGGDWRRIQNVCLPPGAVCESGSRTYSGKYIDQATVGGVAPGTAGHRFSASL